MPRPLAAPPGPHPLLAPLDALEQNHVTSKQGQAACEADDGTLAPGFNCCAVCASTPGGGCPMVKCAACGRVAYCSAACRQLDRAPHGRVCQLLACIDKAEGIEVSEQELVSEFVAHIRGLPRSARHDSWPSVVQPRYAALLGATACEPASEPLPKKQRTAPAPNGEEGAGPSPSPSTAAYARAATDDEQLRLRDALHLALATSYLTFPMTLAAVIRDGGPCAEVAADAAGAGRPLVVAVLGAADTAELAHLDVWKVLQGVVPGVPVWLQFVGLSVPEGVHRQQQQLDSGVAAAFFRGDYNALADEVLKSDVPSTSTAAASDPPAADGDGDAGAGAGAGASASKAALPQVLKALPDMVIGFNCGLSCPDYDWTGCFVALRRFSKAKAKARQQAGAGGGADKPQAAAGKRGREADQAGGASGSGALPAGAAQLPVVLTVNTRLEGLFEADVVSDHMWRQVYPLIPNPFCSLEALQSGTLANDVYRKSAWMTVFELQPAAATKKPAGRQARKKTAWLATTGRKVRKAAGKAARKVKDAARAVAQMLPARWGRRT